MRKALTKNWLIALTVFVSSAASAQSCPEEITGPWEGGLPLADLFSVTLTVQRVGPAAYVGHAATAHSEESAPIWLRSGTMRLQPATMGLSLEGRLAADEGTIDGFITSRRPSTVYRSPAPGRGLGRSTGVRSSTVPREPIWISTLKTRMAAQRAVTSFFRTAACQACTGLAPLVAATRFSSAKAISDWYSGAI